MHLRTHTWPRRCDLLTFRKIGATPSNREKRRGVLQWGRPENPFWMLGVARVKRILTQEAIQQGGRAAGPPILAG